MKLTFAHFKNRAGAVSVRSLALVLCFVMLVTAVGAGTMMTAFAKGRLAEEAYITDAAQKVVDIADSVDIPDASDSAAVVQDVAAAAEKAAEDAPEAEPILPPLSKKVSDLAESGAKAELAKTGDTTYKLQGEFTGWGTSALESTASPAVFEVDLGLGTYDFEILENSTKYGCSSTISDTCSDLTFSSSNSSNCKITTTGGKYSFSYDTTQHKLTVTKTKSALDMLLDGSGVWIYVGAPTSWEQTSFRTSLNNASDWSTRIVSMGTTSDYYAFPLTGGSTADFYCVPLFVPNPGTSYYFGWYTKNDKTLGSSALTAGTAYLFDKSSTLTGKTDINVTANADSLYSVAGTNTAATTLGSALIPQGTPLSVSTASPAASVVGLDNTVKYYLSNGVTCEEVTLNDGNLSTAALALGNYTLYTVIDDGNIKVKTDSDEFTVRQATYSNVTAAAKYAKDASGSNFDTTLEGAISTPTTPQTVANNITVTALEVDGYEFVNWYSDKGTFSDSDELSTVFTPNADNAVAVANYKKVYSIGLSAGEGGTLTSTKNSPAAGESFTVTATPNDGYKIATFTKDAVSIMGANDGLSAITSSSYTASGSNDQFAAFAATFTAKAYPTVNFGAVPYGTVTAKINSVDIESGSHQYEGNTVVFTYTKPAAAGYRFIGWYDNEACEGAALSTNNSYSKAIGSADSESINVYAKIIKYHTVKATYKGDGTGTVAMTSTGTGDTSPSVTNVGRNVEDGKNVTLTATASSGSKFMGWYSDANCKKLISTDNPYTITGVSKTMTVYPYFGFTDYYLSGYLTPSYYANGDNFSYAEAIAHFTADPSDPSIYTLSMSVKNDQYATVTNGTSSCMYPAKDANQVSGTVAGTKTTHSQEESVKKWKAAVSGFKQINYTWNAVDRTLSWTIESMDFSDATVILVDTGYAKSYSWSYTYQSGNPTNYETNKKTLGGNQSLSVYPQVTIGGTTYRMIVFEDNHDLHPDSGDEYTNDRYAISLKDNDGDAGITFAGINSRKVTIIHCDKSNSANNTQTESGTVASKIHKITLNDAETSNKAVDAAVDGTDEFEGKTMTVTAKAKHGYDARVTVTKNSDSSAVTTEVDATNNGQNGKDGSWTFVLPDGDVTVTVEYTLRATHSVTVKASPGGNVTFKDNGTGATAIVKSKNKETFTVIDGDTITLTAAPLNDDILFSAWSGSSSATTATLSNQSVAADKTYTANFTDNPGTLITNIYFLYSTVSNWESGKYYNTRLYYKNGHAYAYLNRAASFASGTTSANGTFNNQFYFNISSNTTAGNRWQYYNTKDTGDTVTSAALSLDESEYDRKKSIYIQIQNSTKFNAIQYMKIDIGEGTISSGTFSFTRSDNRPDYKVYAADSTPSVSSAGEFTLYAKDGAIRSGYTTFADLGDTQIYNTDGDHVGVNGDANLCETYGIDKGETVIIKTKVSAAYKDDYYVRGFLVNGVVPSGTLNTSGKAGGTAVDGGIEYSLTYTLPDDYDGTKGGKYLEITPVYYLEDTVKNKTVTFYVKDFKPELQEVGSESNNDKANWGNTLYAYPFYGTLHGYNNAFGQYPGQPLICYNGQYSIQIPMYACSPFGINSGDEAILNGADDAAKKTQRLAIRVSGITLHNGYYDTVHRKVMGYKYTEDGCTDQKYYQTQTYDFDDFYKIFNENKNIDNIVFQFKYKKYTSGNDNLTLLNSFTASDAASFTTKFGDDFEDLTNFHGRKVNIYGDAISGSALNNNPLYVVSKAGSTSVKNTAGNYATEWVIYKPSAKTGAATYSKVEVTSTDTATTAYQKSSVPPSILLLKGDNSFDNTTYPSAVSGYSITDWKTYYHKLDNYKDCPVKITYEMTKYDVDGDKAARSDGRWLYSSIGESITANIRIDVCKTPGGNVYTPNGSDGEAVDDLEAYFTNAEAYGEMEYATFIDPDKTFNFEAVSNNVDYCFEGWYLDDGNRITLDNSGFSERSANHTFVARFRAVAAGQLKLSHVVGKTASYQGNGTALMSVTVTDAEDNIITSYPTTANDIIIQYDTEHTNYKIKVKLTANAVGEDKFALVSTDADNKYFNNDNNYTVMPDEFSFTVAQVYNSGTPQKSIIYKSYFIATKYQYSIRYQFTGKLKTAAGERVTNSYVKIGTLSSAESADYVTVNPSTGAKVLSDKFVIDSAPYEENFGEDLTWTVPGESARTFTYNAETNTYSLTMNGNDGTTTAVQSKESDKRTITFNLPYFFNGKGQIKVSDGARTAAAYASTEKDKPFATITKNYILSVPYGKVAKPLYNQIGSHAGEYTEEDYVEAPAKLYDATPTITTEVTGVDPDTGRDIVTTTVTYEASTENYKTFRYWSVYSPSDGTEVVRCYTTKFTFAALGNYTITPVYESESVPVTSGADQPAATISYLGPSRNQWNDNGYGNAQLITNANAQKASDLIFEDFVSAFYYPGKDLHGESYPTEVKGTGYIVERIEQLEYFDENHPNTNTEYYSEKYKSGLDTAKNNIKGYIAGTVAKPSNYSIVTFNSTDLDNKDRVQNFYSVYNSRGWNDETNAPASKYTYKKYIYRAFSYIKTGDSANDVTLSEPVYFTMYDIATK